MKYVCFDIGNVLCHLDFKGFLSELSSAVNISESDAFSFLGRTQKLHDLGLTTLKDELRDHFELHSDKVIANLLTKWNVVLRQEDAMFQLLHELILAGVEISLLSNIGFEHADCLEQLVGHLPGFKKANKFYSCHVGARKPTTLYYQSFLSMYPKFKGCLYVDDIQENLDAGKKFGFKTLRFDLNNFDTPIPAQTQQNVKTAVIKLKNLILERNKD